MGWTTSGGLTLDITGTEAPAEGTQTTQQLAVRLTDWLGIFSLSIVGWVDRETERDACFTG